MQVTTIPALPDVVRHLLPDGDNVRGGAFESKYDPESYPPSIAVVEAVASVHDVNPVDLDVLAYTIDPDALDSLLTHQPAENGESVQLAFQYEGLHIYLTSEGEIWLRWADQ